MNTIIAKATAAALAFSVLLALCQATTPLQVASIDTPTDGVVRADDYDGDLQAAVDALGERGGVVLLGPKTYALSRPVLLNRRIAFRGVMDAKAAFASSKVVPASDFTGEWLFETVAKPAQTNPDLNADLGFYDLVVTGSLDIGGLRATNVDILRIERCRFAYMKRCINVTQLTDLERPYPSVIVPGGLFINNSIFQASEICLNLEYTTQNRIYSNWFVSNSGVALRLMNSNKTWFVSNEINQFTRAAIVLEDDGGGGNHVHNNIIAMNWMHSTRPNTRFIEVINGDKISNIQITNNILQGNAGVELPPMTGQSGNRFSGNIGENVRTDNFGITALPAGSLSLVVRHGLLQKPSHVTITPHAEVSAWWIENILPDSFEVRFKTAPTADIPLGWRASIHP